MYNLHTHTKRCGHAKGEDEEYVLAAIENGYDFLGFSDHAPYIFPNGHKSTFRMKPDDARNYADSINFLKQKYADKIDIRLGFELEYYPDLNDGEIDFLRQFGFEYLILGQHFTDNEYEDYAHYSGCETDSTAVLDKYIWQVIKGASTGLFTYVAHPDLINFTGDRKIYLKKIKNMLQNLKEIGIPLEFNFLGFTTGRHYPNSLFWQTAAEIGNKAVIGLDAHDPSVFSNADALKSAREYLSKLGIKEERLSDFYEKL